MNHPKPIKRVIEAFLVLPGIGRKTSEKFAYSLLEASPLRVTELLTAISELTQSITTCPICRRYSEISPCEICSDQNRIDSLLCIISDQKTIPIFEQSGFNGKYFVTGKVLNPLDGVRPEDLPLNQLLALIKNKNITEVILAFNLDTAGESTALLIKKLLEPTGVNITRPARGLTVGAQLEYADEFTLADALQNRRSF